MRLEENVAVALAELGVDPAAAVGVATSGGADSVALLHILAGQRGDSVHALHVDHGLRSDSERDASFVEALAVQLRVPCSVLRGSVTVDRRGSIEAAARRVRYAALGAEAAALGLDCVATAHTRDDQAETVLLKAMRGSPLTGIAPVRGIFVRPLLDVSGAELREWLSARGLEWREDPTNLDRRFERNWVRHDVMPMLAARRPGVAKALARVGSMARADGSVLDSLADEVIGRAEIDDAGVLVGDELQALPPAIAARVVRGALRTFGVEAPTETVEDVVGLGPRGRLRAGHVFVQRIPEGVAFVRDGLAPDPLVLTEAEGGRSDSGWAMNVRLGPRTAEPWTWRTSVPGVAGLSIRSRRPGDRVPTAAGTRKVQDVLVDAKVPLPLRDLVPIVTVRDEPIAVVGFTTAPADGADVLDIEPLRTTWSRAILWNRAVA